MALSVLADDAGRFYATRDGGDTWTLVHGRGEDLRAFAFLTAEHWLALGSPLASTGVYEIRDGGRSWHTYTRAPVEHPLAFTTLGANRIWIIDMPVCPAAVTQRQPNCPGALVRSSDGGRSSQRATLNMIPGTGSLDFPAPIVS